MPLPQYLALPKQHKKEKVCGVHGLILVWEYSKYLVNQFSVHDPGYGLVFIKFKILCRQMTNAVDTKVSLK